MLTSNILHYPPDVNMLHGKVLTSNMLHLQEGGHLTQQRLAGKQKEAGSPRDARAHSAAPSKSAQQEQCVNN